MTDQANNEAFALSILAGQSRPYGIGGCFNPVDWTSAAQYALDTGDWSELEYMQAKEAAWERYNDWACRYPVSGSNGTEYEPPLDFDDWWEREQRRAA